MKISGSYTFDAPQDEVWALLMDPNVISKAIPGVENFTAVAENDYETSLKLGVGAITGQYTGRVTISDVEEPTHYKMKVGGKGQRGFVNGEGSVTLEPQGEKTVVHYVGDAALGGQLAGIGQRLVEGAARTVITQGFKSLEGQLVERRAAQAALLAEAEATAAAAEGLTPEALAEAAMAGAGTTYAPPPRLESQPLPPAAPSSLPVPWIVGGIVALLAILWLLSRRS